MGRFTKWMLLAAVTSAAACGVPEAETPKDPLAFPFSPDASGKSDVFGRSLVGSANPYLPRDLSESTSREDARVRREQAWQTALRILEPVPLLGLAQTAEARASCPSAVVGADLGKCRQATTSDSCVAIQSQGNDICAWQDRCVPACDKLELPSGEAVPSVPRFSTWYGVEDLQRVFRTAYRSLSPEERRERAQLTDEKIFAALAENHTAAERSDRWPLQRYTEAVMRLFSCSLTRASGESDEAFGTRCAEERQSRLSGSAGAGSGIARVLYSPAAVVHVLKNYGEILDCPDRSTEDSWCAGPDCQDPPENFSTCFRSEFPKDGGSVGDQQLGSSVMIKTTWSRVGFGFDLPVFDTSAERMQTRLAPQALANWQQSADRTLASSDAAFPSPSRIHTIQTQSGARYVLTAMHIMTKELRHWQWVTLWWSDTPDSDFGEDRPATFAALPAAFRNYKMCVVSDFTEGDEHLAERFPDYPSLSRAIAATQGGRGSPSWCSNPYIEHGAGNARTNCIGCHQHGGTRLMPDGQMPFVLESILSSEQADLTPLVPFPSSGRTRRRSKFATDYSWAFSRLDALTELLRSETETAGVMDSDWQRLNRLVAAQTGNVERGSELFASHCTGCHGPTGEGGSGPNLATSFATKTRWQLASTMVFGRGQMPAWGQSLEDGQLVDLLRFLDDAFGP